MAEKPILFNTEMVRAILEGRKTQTRRLVKPRLTKNEAGWRVCKSADGRAYAIETFDDEEFFQGYVVPPVQRGDVLWVRETWRRHTAVTFGGGMICRYLYRADEPRDTTDRTKEEDRWHPSIHMPRDAARLFLKVTDVRIERVQDMSAEDCANDGGFEPEAIKTVGIAPLFGTLWDSTVRKDDLKRYGWAANPWVWVYEFERGEKP